MGYTVYLGGRKVAFCSQSLNLLVGKKDIRALVLHALVMDLLDTVLLAHEKSKLRDQF